MMRGSEQREAGGEPVEEVRPPTGPISPAQNIPASGIGPSSSSTTPASWSGSPKRLRPRPLHVNSSAAGRRRRSAARAGPRRRPPRRGRGTAPSGRRRRARRPRSHRSPGRRRPRCAPGSRRVRSRPGARRPRSRAGGRAHERAVLLRRPRTRSPARDRSRACPASSSTKFRSPRVTTKGSPIGRQPCDTTVRTGTPRGTPAAPVRVTRSSSTRRLPPGPRAADAAPPTTCSRSPSSERSSFTRWRNASVGKVNGSASRSSDRRSMSRSGQPVDRGAVGRALRR